MGTYTLSPAGGSADNYGFTYVAGNLVIQAAAQDVTSEGYTGTYDGSAHGITVTQTGGTVTYGTVPDTYDLTEPPVYTNAGDYTVYFKVVKANYEDYTGSATLKINKAILTATYGGETVTYGNVPVLSVNVTGFVNGETAETAAGYAAPTTINTNVNAGTYTLNPSGGAADNYDFSYVAEDLIIQPKTVSVTPDALSKVYGGSDPVFTYTLSETVAVTGALSREPGEDVGTYAITPGDLSAGGNYTLSLAPTNFAVTKATLTIKADDKAMTFGGAEPEYTVTCTGFVNGETQTALTGTLSVTSGYDSGVYAPTAVITASGLTSGNYAITYETGVLTVSKIQVDAPTAVTGLAYNGIQQTGVSAAAGYTLTGNTEINAGDYTATATLADGYIWSDASTAAKTIPWNIIPKAVNLTVDQIDDQTYTGSVIEPEILIRDGSSPLVMGTDYTISYSDNVNAGIATITATGMGNYSGSSGSGTFTVLRKTVDVSPLIWDYASSFVYDGTTKSVSLTYVPEGLTAQYIDSSKMDAGDFTASVILVPDGNHGISGTVEDLEWSIDPKVITVTPDALSKVYGGADPVLSYALSEPVSVTGALGRDSGESVGTYAITIGTLSAGGNHEIIMVDPAVAFEILADCPGAPSIVGVEPGNGQVGLIWNAPGTDGGVPITGYEVWYKVGQTGDWMIRYCTTTVEDGTVTGLINGQVCAFRPKSSERAGYGAVTIPK